MTSTRQTAAAQTLAHTQLAAAWLWNSRDCRVIADEVGVSWDGTRIEPPTQTKWRADVVGVSWHADSPTAGVRFGAPVFDVIEVKGHRADWRREKPLDPRSKWQRSRNSTLRLWLLVSSSIGDDLLTDLPPWWGILRADDETASGLRTIRKAPQSGTVADDLIARSLYAVAQRSATRQLPTMRHARDERGVLHQGTIAASLLNLRRPGCRWPSIPTEISPEPDTEQLSGPTQF